MPHPDRRCSARPGPDADDRDHPVRVVAVHQGEVAVQHRPDLAGDRGEHLLRGLSSSDQRRHPLQRGLLLGEAAQLHPRLRVRDRGADQLCEVGQPGLGVRRQWLPARGGHEHDAPDAAFEGDGHPDGGADAHRTHRLGGRAGPGGEVVDPRRSPGLEHQSGHVPATERRPGRRCRVGVRHAPPDHGHHTVRVVAAHRRHLDGHQLPDLGRDRREDLFRRPALGDEGRHSAQCRLFLGDATHFRGQRLRLPPAPLRSGRQAADHVRGENGDHQLRHGVRVGDRQSEQRRGDEELEHQRRQDGHGERPGEAPSHGDRQDRQDVQRCQGLDGDDRLQPHDDDGQDRDLGKAQQRAPSRRAATRLRETPPATPVAQPHAASASPAIHRQPGHAVQDRRPAAHRRRSRATAEG